MKKFTPFYFALLLIMPFSLIAQNFVDEEVDGLAEKIATKIDAKNDRLKKREKFKSILVEDFTDTEGNVSKLGASLAEEFSLALSSAGITFSVTGAHDLAVSPPKKKSKLNFRQALQGVEKLADGVTDDTNYELNRKTRDAAKTIDGANDVGTAIEKDKSRYQGIDAVVTGTLTESNDQYRLLIKVISTGKGYPMVTNAKGFITKTPFILKLEDEANKRRQTSGADDSFTSKGNSRSSARGGSAQQVFASNNAEVELLELKQVGQNIEAYFRITNTGPDLEFYMYGKGSGGKLIDSNNSYDYPAAQVKLGELMDNRHVKKTLVTSNPVEAKVTFSGVARDVRNIAKLTVKCHGHGGYFWIELRDVNVN